MNPRKEERKGAEDVFEEIRAENFSNLGKEKDIQIQDAHGTPIKINKIRPTPKHIIAKFANYSDKEKILKAARQKSP